MILYHYSVDSYNGDSYLINDYKNLYQYVEPFVLALEKGPECFWSTYFSTMSYSRELIALGLRKHENYIKDATEGVFEYVRQHEFLNNSVSRVKCVYYCDSAETAISYLKEDCINNGDFTLDKVKLLEVDVNDNSIYSYDQFFFNEAERIMENDRDLGKVIDLAREYFAEKRSNNPIIEFLSDGENEIIREIPISAVK